MKKATSSYTDYGIEIHIDEEGHVLETREQIQGAFNDLKQLYRLEALK